MSADPPAGAEQAGQTDWSALRAAAAQVRERAYAPYSQYLVGAAARTADGRLLTGCNVENASLGMTLCAECGVVSDLHRTGGGRLVAVACTGGRTGSESHPVLPCGRCRQLLSEQGGPDLLVDTADGPVRLAVLLPGAFGSADLRR
jgi:cytidine deaminase